MVVEPFPELEWFFFYIWPFVWVGLTVATFVTQNVLYTVAIVPLAFFTVCVCGVVHKWRRRKCR